MADHNADVEDVASVMERLWGPREQAPPDAVLVPTKDLWGTGRGVERPEPRRIPRAPEPSTASEPTAATAAGALDMDALHDRMEAALAERLAKLRAELISAVTSADERLNRRVDALAAEVAAADAARRAAVPSEDLTVVAEERVALVENSLLARLDDLREEIRVEVGELARSIPDPDVARERLDEQLAPIRAGVAAAAARASESEARLLIGLEDASGRTAAVGDRLDTEVGRLAEALGRVEAGSLTDADLDSVRRAMETELREARGQDQAAQVDAATRIEEVRSELKGSADAAAASVALLDLRLDGLSERLSAATAALAASVHADHLAVQSLHHRLGLVRAELPFRLERAMEDLRARSVTKGDLAATRSECKRLVTRRLAPIETEARRVAAVLDDVTAGAAERIVDRLDEMAAWVLAQATRAAERVAAERMAASPVALASLKRETRAVKSRVASG